MSTSKNKTPVYSEDVKTGIRLIKINRPDALNALNLETIARLTEELHEAEKDPKIRTVVLTGEGTKAFIAGADILEMSKMSDSQAVQFARLGQEATKILESMHKPTIAAVNGFALGGGTEFAISCDFIYASDNAVFGQPEVCLGVIPGFGGTIRLSRFVGVPLAKELIFTGRKIKADEALRIGLVSQVFKSETLLEEVIKIADTISQNSALAVGKAKKLLNEFSGAMGNHYRFDAEAQEFGGLFGGHDQKEGMAAFLEKRKAVFQKEASFT
jgi:enoyl-CoA hydratase